MGMLEKSFHVLCACSFLVSKQILTLVLALSSRSKRDSRALANHTTSPCLKQRKRGFSGIHYLKV